jgi:hypothetical protein
MSIRWNLITDVSGERKWDRRDFVRDSDVVIDGNGDRASLGGAWLQVLGDLECHLGLGDQ